MILKPAGETRLIVTPLGDAPPLKRGDTLPNGLIVSGLADCFKLGNRTCWRYFVQRVQPMRRMSGALAI